MGHTENGTSTRDPAGAKVIVPLTGSEVPNLRRLAKALGTAHGGAWKAEHTMRAVLKVRGGTMPPGTQRFFDFLEKVPPEIREAVHQLGRDSLCILYGMLQGAGGGDVDLPRDIKAWWAGTGGDSTPSWPDYPEPSWSDYPENAKCTPSLEGQIKEQLKKRYPEKYQQAAGSLEPGLVVGEQSPPAIEEGEVKSIVPPISITKMEVWRDPTRYESVVALSFWLGTRRYSTKVALSDDLLHQPAGTVVEAVARQIRVAIYKTLQSMVEAEVKRALAAHGKELSPLLDFSRKHDYPLPRPLLPDVLDRNTAR